MLENVNSVATQLVGQIGVITTPNHLRLVNAKLNVLRLKPAMTDLTHGREHQSVSTGGRIIISTANQVGIYNKQGIPVSLANRTDVGYSIMSTYSLDARGILFGGYNAVAGSPHTRKIRQMDSSAAITAQTSDLASADYYRHSTAKCSTANGIVQGRGHASLRISKTAILNTAAVLSDSDHFAAGGGKTDGNVMFYGGSVAGYSWVDVADAKPSNKLRKYNASNAAVSLTTSLGNGRHLTGACAFNEGLMVSGGYGNGTASVRDTDLFNWNGSVRTLNRVISYDDAVSRSCLIE